MSPDIIIWAIAFVVLTIAELETVQFVSIWFALAALVSMFTALAGLPIIGQITVFVIASVILLLATRPLVKKLTAKKNFPTNIELDIGQTAYVINDIDNAQAVGRVKLNGVDWMARSSDNSIISAGEAVVVEKVDGTRLIVKKY